MKMIHSLKKFTHSIYYSIIPSNARRDIWHYWYTGRSYHASLSYPYVMENIFPNSIIPFPQNTNDQEKVSIVIVTYNNVTYTNLTIQSILLNTNYSNYKIVIVDNNSNSSMIDSLHALEVNYSDYVSVIYNSENVGFAAANNIGIAQATDSTYVVLLNSDVIVTIGWLTTLIHHLGDTAVGMVGPVTNFVGNEARVSVSYTRLSDIALFAEDYTMKHKGKSFQIRMLAMFCVALRTATLQEIGPLDERFGLGYFEDDDYSERMHRAGYKLLCAQDVFIHHFGGASFSTLENTQFNALFAQNKKLFEEKWHMKWIPQRAKPSLVRNIVGSLVSMGLSIFHSNKEVQ